MVGVLRNELARTGTHNTALGPLTGPWLDSGLLRSPASSRCTLLFLGLFDQVFLPPSSYGRLLFVARSTNL